MVGLSVKVGELALEDDMLSFSLQQELAEQNRQQQQIEACTERLFFIDRNAEARPAVPWNHYKLAMMTEEEEMQFLAQHPEALQAVPSGPSLDDTLQVMECLEEFSAMCKKIARSM